MGDSFNPNTYGDNFIADLVAFVAADEFQSMFETFFIQFALEFDDDDEHKLRYTEIYQSFQSMFEEQLMVFCHSKNVTMEECFRRCRDVSDEDDKTRHYI